MRRPGRPVQQMSWDRVSEWEIEERKGYVLLTLRGRGATTPLVVPGWSLDDLEILMRDVTPHAATYVPDGARSRSSTDGNGAATAAAALPAPAAATWRRGRPRQRPPAHAPAAAAAARLPAPRPQRRQLRAHPHTDACQRGDRSRARPVTGGAASAATTRTGAHARPRQVTWKAVVTVVLLGALVTAVTLVLLQSAGIINWGFLGPVA